MLHLLNLVMSEYKPEELRQWLVSKRKQAMAALNKDELFWMFLHEINNSRREQKLPQKLVPNLGLLQAHPPGTFHQLDHMLCERITEFIPALASPTAHPYHWQQQAQTLRLLLKHFSQLHNIFILVYSIMYDNPNAFTNASDCYVAVHCKPYKITAAKKYLSNFPACEDEDICMLPNFNSTAHKCKCCEMPDEDILIPELSIFIPTTPNGSQDENQNFTASTSKLQDCLIPDNN
jgi:hypothetical protein